MFGLFDRSASRSILPIGLDLGTVHLKAVQMAQPRRRRDGRGAGGGDRADARRRPPRSRGDAGRVLRETVAPLIHRAGFHGRRVALALPAAHTFASRLRLSASAGEADMRHAVRCHAQDFLPFPASRATVRHVDAGEVYEHGQVCREVLALAMRKLLDQLIAAASGAGSTSSPLRRSRWRCWPHCRPKITRCSARRRPGCWSTSATPPPACTRGGRELMFARVLGSGRSSYAAELRPAGSTSTRRSRPAARGSRLHRRRVQQPRVLPHTSRSDRAARPSRPAEGGAGGGVEPDRRSGRNRKRDRDHRGVTTAHVATRHRTHARL